MPANQLREREFPITAEYVYLNTATQGPLPSSAVQAVEQTARHAQFPGTPPAQGDPIERRARAGLASLLNVGEDDLVFTSNTTTGLNMCAHGIDWRPGDNVVLPDNEFPSVMRTWLNLRDYGVEVRLVPWHGAGPGVDELMAATDAHTRVVSCSAVAWDSGYRIDLAELGRRCAMAGILSVVDGIQAVGAIDIQPRESGISALSMHGYKWLMAGFGCGALYLSPDAQNHIRPRFVGEQSFQTKYGAFNPDTPWQPGARRFAVGGSNYLGLAALASSLDLIAGVGIHAIAAHNQSLGQLLLEGLGRISPDIQVITPTEPSQRAAIVVFTLGDPARDQGLFNALATRGIMVALRPRGIRVSPHLFNTSGEIETLLEELPAIIASL